MKTYKIEVENSSSYPLVLVSTSTEELEKAKTAAKSVLNILKQNGYNNEALDFQLHLRTFIGDI